ncbi:two-component regulator propeller domain-containing protein [Flavobacterium sp. ZS1P70]|uniref:histidine kinase n=1 Tax=Flavobacterium zhoui TaxID=3230414 RepID=A0ABW6I0E8_9FLAO
MKNFSIVFIFISCCLGLSNIGHAQQKQQLYFEKYDVKSGLPESSVNDMKEDQQGYIWMATQNGLVRYDGYRYKVYQLGTKKTNLDPISNVRDLHMDRNNTLWAGVSANGLFRYNSNSDTFIQFVYPEKDVAITYTILTDDKSGNLWGTVDMDEGKKNYLWKLDKKGHFDFFGKKFKNTSYVDATRIYSAFTSASGKVWFGTNNGFYSYEGKNIPLKGYNTTANPEQAKEVVYMYEPPSEPGIFWMVSFHGKFKDSKIVRFDSKLNTYKELIPKPEYFSYANATSISIDSYISKFFNSIYEDKKQQLWFAGFDGLVRLNRKTATFDYFKTGFKYANVSETDRVYAIKETKEGPFWLSSLNGLVHFDPKTMQFERYQSDPDRPGTVLANREIYSKIIDHTGTFWIGFGWAGANKSNRIKSAFSIYKHNPKQIDSYPKDGGYFASGEKGYKWFSNKDAIYKWKQETNSFIKTYIADPEDHFIGQGCLTKDGNFYIPTFKHLVFYNTKTGKKEKYATDKIIQETILLFPFEDDNGLIWLRTDGKGICSFNPKTKKFKAYPYRENGEKLTEQNAGALDDIRVTSTYVDRQHHFWVGTNQGSLNLYNPTKEGFISYYNSKDKAMRCITSIYEDRSGRLWVGTYQDGLFEFDRKKGRWTRHLNEASGLLFNGVLGINEDTLGLLWVATERGLSRINPKNLSVKNFPLNVILTGYDIEKFMQYLFKLDDGSLMFTLTNGVAVFNPKDLDANPFPPKVHLEEIVYSNPDAYKKDETNRATFGLKKLELPYNQNRVRFNYIGLQYDNPLENTYAYKLDGYDKGWVQAGTQRSVTYTNLSPGEYTFNLKAANSDEAWSKAKSVITIIISPPWWQTIWAYLLYGIFFVGSMRTYIVFRARNLKRENKVLEEKVTHRTNQLTRSIEDLKTTQTQLIQSEKMASLGELTAGIAHEIQNPLNFVNNFSEVSMELIDEMEEEMAKGDTAEAIAIASDIKQNLEKINYHGKRADSIVKGMLQHSRAGNNVKEPTNINALADEYLRLAYHGLRAKDKSFNAELITNFDEQLPKINVIPQDVGRVLLNLFTNAFYATHQMQKIAKGDYKPMVSVTTTQNEKFVVITVKDNGIGIPDAIKDKIMQPFFTTKPTGEGTGLGLSLSYDIVVKTHGGKIAIDSIEKEYTIFTIQLPL